MQYPMFAFVQLELFQSCAAEHGGTDYACCEAWRDFLVHRQVEVLETRVRRSQARKRHSEAVAVVQVHATKAQVSQRGRRRHQLCKRFVQPDTSAPPVSADPYKDTDCSVG